MKPLHDLIVVEFAGSVAGAYCAKMFTDGGATVLLVGDGSLNAHQALYLNADKQPVTIDDVDFGSVDVVIRSSAPDPLSPVDFTNDQLVLVQISPLGNTGKRAHWKSTDLTDYAASGHAYLYGDPEREPLRGPADQPAVASGLFGFVGAMAALLSRDRLGRGQTVDICHLQVMVALHQVTLLRWLMAGDVFCRMGNRYTGQGQPNGPYRCSDGWVSIVGVASQQVESLLAVTGLLHLLDLPEIESPMDFQSYPELLDAPLNEWLSTQKVDDVVELFQAMRIPTAPLLDPLALLDDPQLVAREFFKPVDSHPDLSVPGPPFSVGHEQPRGDGAWTPDDLRRGPLAGLRVLDMARVWAGPLCARILSDLGADVVWVEAPWHRGPQQIPQSVIDASRQFPNDDAGERQWNRNSHFVKYSLGKRSLAIDMQTPEGREVLEQLVPKFHVLLENFSSRVMPQFELGEDQLHELNPDLIYLTMPGYGRSGPAEHWLAYGSCVDSHAGLSSLIGYRDQSPWKGGVAWPDPIAGLHAASAVLSLLWSGLASGTGGATIEAAQFESTVAAIGDRMVEAQVNGPFKPDGNRQADFVAQGVYRCVGDDNWIAISIPDDETLQRLAAFTRVELSNVVTVVTAEDHDAFDAALNDFTRGRHAEDLAVELQAVGIPAAKVAKAPDLMIDPHLASIDNWVTVDQPDIGAFTAPVTPINLSATPVHRPGPAPTLGEHNEQVLLEAGIDPEYIASLKSAHIIVTEPPN